MGAGEDGGDGSLIGLGDLYSLDSGRQGTMPSRLQLPGHTNRNSTGILERQPGPG